MSAPVAPARLTVHMGFISEEATLCEAVEAPESHPAAASMIPLLSRQLARVPPHVKLCPECLVAFWAAYEETLEVAQ